MQLLYRTTTVVVVKVTSHPESHKVPMDMRECDRNSGTMCALRAARGSTGMGSLASCVEVMTDPLGFRMVMGFLARCLLKTGRSTVKNVSVLPVSAIATQYWMGDQSLEHVEFYT